jgi:hypothetical protein
MIISTKHFSDAKIERFEKKHVTGVKAARIASKRFNKAERKAVKLLLKNLV